MVLFRKPEPPPPPPDDTDRLLEIAAKLSPDGGVAGGDPEDRALKTVSALLFFLSQGHTPTQGAFRAHVERMIRFLASVDLRRELLARVIDFARAGMRPAKQVSSWNEVDAALAPGSFQ
jgi:hypothetical protein